MEEYFISQKIEKAKELLKYDELSLVRNVQRLVSDARRNAERWQHEI